MRQRDPAEVPTGWKRLTVDKDWPANAAENMADTAVAKCTAAVAANPGSSEAKKLQQATMLKNAPKTSWKSLRLTGYGGGADRYRSLVSDKAAVGDDDAAVALARKPPAPILDARESTREPRHRQTALFKDDARAARAQ